jgi:ubiquinone biosynthesis protein UbiJ
MPSALISGLGDAVTARLILLANHVIASEPTAMLKLQPHVGRSIELRFHSQARLPVLGAVSSWLPSSVSLRITPAGLLEQINAPTEPPLVEGPVGLSVSIELPHPAAALRMLVQRQRPDVQIDGDASFAEAVSWLMKNLRWDLEDDLARWLGAPPTQLLKNLAQQVAQALSRWRPGATAPNDHAGR